MVPPLNLAISTQIKMKLVIDILLVKIFQTHKSFDDVIVILNY